MDGKQTEVGPSAEGHVQITVEPGEHTLTLSFEDTRPRTAGKLVSAVSLLVWLAILYVSRKAMRRKFKGSRSLAPPGDVERRIWA